MAVIPQLGKFANNRDEMLDLLCLQEWSNQGSGDSEAPTGYFYRISIEKSDRNDLNDAFGEEIQREGLIFDDLLGHWLIVENDRGDVTVHKYDTPDDLHNKFLKLEAQYLEWSAE